MTSPGPASPEGITPEPVTGRAPPLARPVILNQDWRDLTFLHWAVDADRVARFMPPGVRPDTLEGRSYVGLVPFRMVDAGLGSGPGVPWLGSFLETNVRLYSVDATGRRGIVFLSLDADRLAVVAAARAGFGLPYRWARMSHTDRRGAGFEDHFYESRVRWPRRAGRSRTRVSIRAGEPRSTTVLDEFLSARWGLHVRHLGRTLYVPNRHPPWSLRHCELLDLDDGLLAAAGLGDLAGRPPDHLAFSDGVHTEFGRPGTATRPRTG